jgi:putative transposase
MPRRRRLAPDNCVQHVLNRGNERATIFHEPADYAAFLNILADGLQRVALRILAFCLMRNHFHLVVWPATTSELSAYMQWTMSVHVRRYRQHHASVGQGHVYQDRYRSFLIQDERHFLTVARYVEGNAMRAGIVGQAESWPWTSASRSTAPDGRALLSDWPFEKPENWLEAVNGGVTLEELERLRFSARRGAPYGDEAWVAATAARFGLESTFRPPHRPRKWDSPPLSQKWEKGGLSPFPG